MEQNEDFSKLNLRFKNGKFITSKNYTLKKKDDFNFPLEEFLDINGITGTKYEVTSCIYSGSHCFLTLEEYIPLKIETVEEFNSRYDEIFQLIMEGDPDANNPEALKNLILKVNIKNLKIIQKFCVWKKKLFMAQDSENSLLKALWMITKESRNKRNIILSDQYSRRIGMNIKNCTYKGNHEKVNNRCLVFNVTKYTKEGNSQNVKILFDMVSKKRIVHYDGSFEEEKKIELNNFEEFVKTYVELKESQKEVKAFEKSVLGFSCRDYHMYGAGSKLKMHIYVNYYRNNLQEELDYTLKQKFFEEYLLEKFGFNAKKKNLKEFKNIWKQLIERDLYGKYLEDERAEEKLESAEEVVDFLPDPNNEEEDEERMQPTNDESNVPVFKFEFREINGRRFLEFTYSVEDVSVAWHFACFLIFELKETKEKKIELEIFKAFDLSCYQYQDHHLYLRITSIQAKFCYKTKTLVAAVNKDTGLSGLISRYCDIMYANNTKKAVLIESFEFSGFFGISDLEFDIENGEVMFGVKQEGRWVIECRMKVDFPGLIKREVSNKY